MCVSACAIRSEAPAAGFRQRESAVAICLLFQQLSALSVFVASSLYPLYNPVPRMSRSQSGLP
jgi:hypothetical protein